MFLGLQEVFYVLGKTNGKDPVVDDVPEMELLVF